MTQEEQIKEYGYNCGYELTLVCFCKAHSFCHRYLLTEYLQKFGAIYKGKRDV
jgi:hypothetical protein